MFSVCPLEVDEISGGLTITSYCQDVLAIKDKRNILPPFIVGCTYYIHNSCLINLVQIIYFLKGLVNPISIL
jgi:hypothetical protein